jgi:hypothetical protein
VRVEEVAFAGTRGLLAGGASETGVVVAHGGRGPGKHLFRDEVVALAERGHLALAPDTRLPPLGDAEAELRAFEAVLEIHRQALDRRHGFDDPQYLAAVRGLDPVDYVAVPGPARLFQYGRHDTVVAAEDAYALYEAAAEPKLWRSYDCGHGVDADPRARLDRHAFLDEELRAA